MNKIWFYFENQFNNDLNKISLNSFLRTFLWGESPFTTLLYSNGEILFANEHFKRLKDALLLFYPEISYSEFEKDVKDALKKISKKNEFQECDLRLRISFSVHCESEEQIFSPILSDHYQVKPFIIISPFVNRLNSLKNLSVKIIDKNIISSEEFYKIKHGNYWKGIQDKLQKAFKYDEILFFDKEKKLMDSLFSNIFIMREGKIIVPKLNSNILDGIFRKKLLIFLEQYQYPFECRDIDENDVYLSENIFLGNSLKGIQEINTLTYNGQEFFKKNLPKKFLDNFNEYCRFCWTKII